MPRLVKIEPRDVVIHLKRDYGSSLTYTRLDYSGQDEMKIECKNADIFVYLDDKVPDEEAMRRSHK